MSQPDPSFPPLRAVTASESSPLSHPESNHDTGDCNGSGTDSGAVAGASGGPLAKDSSRRRLGPHVWKLLIEAFRHQPDHMIVSRLVGVDPRTAKKAWNEGLPYAFTAGKSIRQIVEEEQALARSALNEPTPAQLDIGRKDAVEARTEQARMVRKARQNAAELLEVTAQLVEAGKGVAAELAAEMKSSKIDVDRKVRMLKNVGALVAQSAESTKAVLALEEALLGKGPVDGAPRELTDEEMREELRAAESALARARAKGWGGVAAAPGDEAATPEPSGAAEAQEGPVAGEEPALEF